MKPIFEYSDYKAYVNDWLYIQPKKGRGLLSQIAATLGIHTTLLSHTLRGDKNLTCEQAILLAEYIGLQDLEINFLLLLVQKERAGNLKLKQKYDRDIQQIKAESQQIAKRVISNIELTEEQKAQFYSSWLYSAARQLTSIASYQSTSEIFNAFPINKNEVSRVLTFLLSSGLCVEKNGKIHIGPTNTHISSQSPFVFQHHKNWRIKAFEKHNNLLPEELMYTAPFTISNKDFEYFREEVIKLIQTLIKTAEKTKNERLACLNIDLFFIK